MNNGIERKAALRFVPWRRFYNMTSKGVERGMDSRGRLSLQMLGWRVDSRGRLSLQMLGWRTDSRGRLSLQILRGGWTVEDACPYKCWDGERIVEDACPYKKNKPCAIQDLFANFIVRLCI